MGLLYSVTFNFASQFVGVTWCAMNETSISGNRTWFKFVSQVNRPFNHDLSFSSSPFSYLPIYSNYFLIFSARNKGIELVFTSSCFLKRVLKNGDSSHCFVIFECKFCSKKCVLGVFGFGWTD
jgi:hypothetical protein